MNVNYSTSTTHNPSDVCPICFEPLGERGVIAHDGATKPLHEVHTKCMQAWGRVNATCTECRASVNCSSLFSLKTRVVAGCKNVAKVSLYALAAVAIFGAGALAAYLNKGAPLTLGVQFPHLYGH